MSEDDTQPEGSMPEADLACDDERVLDLLVKDGYLTEVGGLYYVTPKGEEAGLGPEELAPDSDEIPETPRG